MMTLLAVPVWPFISAAWLLLAAGILLAAWALLWDRPRGHRRCPNCWYDMAGVPGLVCPECGRDARREGRLFTTRRRWRLAAVGFVTIATGIGVHQVGSIIGGWPQRAPDWLLVASLPWMETGNQFNPAAAPAAGSGFEVLLSRVMRGELATRQYSRLVRLCERGDRERPPRSDEWAAHYLPFLKTASHELPPTAGDGRGPDAAAVEAARQALARSLLEAFPVHSESDEYVVRLDERWLPLGLELRACGESDWFGFRQRGWAWWDRTLGPFAATGVRNGERTVLELEVRYRLRQTFRHPGEVWRTQITLGPAPAQQRTAVEAQELERSLREDLDAGFSLASYYDGDPLLWVAIDVRPASGGGAGSGSVGAGLLANPTLALAVRLDVINGDEVVATGEAWWTGETLSQSPAEPGGELVVLRWARPSAGGWDGDWRLRITGDERVAQRAPVSRFWGGSIEVPLRILTDDPPWIGRRP